MSMDESTSNDVINNANHSIETMNQNASKTNGSVDNQVNRNTIDDDETVSNCNSDFDSSCSTIKLLSEENKCTNTDERADDADNSSKKKSDVCGKISKSTHENQNDACPIENSNENDRDDSSIAKNEIAIGIEESTCSNECDVNQVEHENVNVCDSSNAGSCMVRIERSNDNEDGSSIVCNSADSSSCNSKDNFSRQFSNPMTQNRSRFSNPPIQSSSMSECDECDDDCMNSIMQRSEQNKGLINNATTSTT